MNARGIKPIRRLINMFGALAYSLLIFTYAVIVGAGLLWLARSGLLMQLGVSPETVQPALAPPTTPSDTTPRAVPFLLQVVQLVLMSVMTVAVLGVVVMLPYWLGRCGSYLLKRSIRLCHSQVTLATLLFGKILACGIGTVPVLIMAMYDARQWPIAAVLLGVITVALVLFATQHYLAKSSEVVEAKDVW